MNVISEAFGKCFNAMKPYLNEKQRRLLCGCMAQFSGPGGVTGMKEATGVSRTTIQAGMKELASGASADAEQVTEKERVRREGAGRRPIEETQPGIRDALNRLVEGATYGNPENPLLWTTKSLRNLADELIAQGFTISHNKVGELLEDMGYSLQSNRKMLQVGSKHPDRDEQFSMINTLAKEFMAEGQPVISMDCKKKELVGNYANGGREYRPEKNPVHVLDHDFELNKAAPYGIYDIARNEGYVNVGVSSDTAEFAVNSLRNWWVSMGHERYPGATRLLVTCDGGGGNGSRNRLWKLELQKFADDTGLEVWVSHFPPGTSKWNKIEHRMFSYISKNWRAKPLETYQIIVNLIASTTTKTGLKIECGLDERIYEKGIKVDDDEFASINLVKNAFHGDWNYAILPHEVVTG